MPLTEHEFPILEYDSEQMAVVMPGRNNIFELPERCVLGFLGDYIDMYAGEHGLEPVAGYRSLMRMNPVYAASVNGEDIAVCSVPVGAPASVSIMDWMIGHGVKKIVAIGGCGTLIDIPENEMLLPKAALHDEGTSYHYLPPSREIVLDEAAVSGIKRTLDALGIKSAFVKTWTTDAFFRETRDMVARRKAEGCSVVEMECAALAACARFRGVLFGQILFTQDSLANVELYDERQWGIDSFDKALAIALEAACAL